MNSSAMDRSMFKQNTDIYNPSAPEKAPKFCTPKEVRARPGMHYMPNVKSTGADGGNPPLIALSKLAMKQIAEYKAAHPEAHN